MSEGLEVDFHQGDIGAVIFEFFDRFPAHVLVEVLAVWGVEIKGFDTGFAGMLHDFQNDSSAHLIFAIIGVDEDTGEPGLEFGAFGHI